MNNMLLNCPRCGFSQPKDRYCANCGVDMDNYKPKPTNPVKKLLASPFFHIFIIAVIVMGSVVAIKQRQKEELQARIEFLKSGPVMVERQNLSQETQTEVSVSPEAEANLVDQNLASEAPTIPAQQASAEANSATVAAMGAPSAPVGAATNERGTTAPGRVASSLKMIATYMEVDQSVLTAWLEEAKATGQQRVFEGVTMGPLLQAATKLKTPNGLRVLQTVERNLDPGNPTQEWFVGTHQGSDPDQQVGFFSSLALTELREGFIRGDIEVQRSFRNPQDPTRTIERVSFGSPFEIGSGSAYILSGLLPVTYATTLGDETNPDPFLQIFKSQSFIGRRTQFTLIIQFVTSSASAPRQ